MTTIPAAQAIHNAVQAIRNEQAKLNAMIDQEYDEVAVDRMCVAYQTLAWVLNPVNHDPPSDVLARSTRPSRRPPKLTLVEDPE